MALDARSFNVRRVNAAGDPVQGGKVAFNVLGAYGWPKYGRGKGSLLALYAAPNFNLKQGFPYWVDFLGGLRKQLGDGPPFQIVCDQDADILDAVETLWPASQGPSPVIFNCHWHLAKNLRKILGEEGVARGDTLRQHLDHQPDNALCPCIFCGDGQRWDAWETDALSRHIRRLTNWINRNGTRIRWQLDNHSKLGAQTSSGPLEQRLTMIGDAFNNRRGMLKNRERLQRRLLLMQLQLNGQANIGQYARIVRAELLKNGGFGAARYLVDDKAGSSLRVH